ncbi:MAG: threonine-phosphate decarboxylase [Bosea sp.]|jgi:cobalamin biosynthetic protein CobC|nr:threonine-phosphate decarboxylase [Bosea sp. (in: a-proteobacteria)]
MLHGGDLTGAMAQFGGGRGGWLDLSTGINPHPYPLPDIAPHFWQTLPTQGDLDALLKAAREAYRVPDKASLVAAPGTQALIQWMARLAPVGSTAVLGPTYNEHARAFRDAGRAITEISDLGDWRGQTNLIVVNPNNPDGRLLPQSALADLATEAARRSGWLLIDESFVDVMPDATAAELCVEQPVVILRSFGKFYGLAGVRLGCVIASDEIASGFAVALGPWSVAGPALAIGETALQDQAWADAMRARLMQEAGQLDAVLVNAGFEMIGGTVLYRLVRHLEAAAVHAHLAHHHIWVRKFDWDSGLLRFGLPGSEASLARLERALLAFAPHARPHGVTTFSPSTV